MDNVYDILTETVIVVTILVRILRRKQPYAYKTNDQKQYLH